MALRLNHVFAHHPAQLVRHLLHYALTLALDFDLKLKTMRKLSAAGSFNTLGRVKIALNCCKATLKGLRSCAAAMNLCILSASSAGKSKDPRQTNYFLSLVRSFFTIKLLTALQS